MSGYAGKRMSIDHNPRFDYEKRLGNWLQKKTAEDRLYVRIGNYRLGTAAVAALMAWFAYGRPVISGWWLLVPVVVFASLVIWHAGVARAQEMAGRAIELYKRGLNRLNDNWAGVGETGEGYASPDHVYSSDLDIFGQGSLFQMISTARTVAGEQTLARWLERPAAQDAVVERQQAAQELAGLDDLREALALLGTVVRAGIHPDTLREWGKAPAVVFALWVRPAATILAVLAVAATIAFFAGAVPLSAVVGVLALNACLIVFLKNRTGQVLNGCDVPAADLEILGVLIERLERESFATPLLSRLRASLNLEGLAASRRIRQLERLMGWLDSSHHVLVRVIAPMLLWREHLAIMIETWRRRNGAAVAGWLEVCGEFEALSSLGTICYERPDWVFPEILTGDRPSLEATSLRHPLLSRAKAVPNDVTLDGPGRAWIVSGSNMSGKSTLLRAVGVNIVLACAGAPVAATGMRVPALQVGASLRNVDSLQDGRSRFLAEITRIRKIRDLTRDGEAVLFLLDELLSGTNSHDRRIGAAAIVKGLLDRGAIGMLTTHDLALAELEADLGGQVVNVHFDDHITDGQLQFDYKLRPGVVTHSNALELMRAVGVIE